MGGLFGGGGGGGGLLGGLPIVGGLFGGGQQQMQPMGMSPMPFFPGGMPYMPQSQGAWPVAQQPKQSFTGDFSKPGAAENYWEKNAGAYGQPSATGQYWASVSGKSAPQSSNNAASAYKTFANSTPADTSSYYDRAAQRSMQDIQRAAAATGQLGAGTTNRSIADAMAGIRATQAKDDAQYGLQRGGLLGSLASGADASSSRAMNDRLGWLTGMGSLAGMSDQASLARLNAGMGAASAAQGAARERGQDFFGNNLAMGNAMGGALQNVYGQQILADQGLLASLIQAQLGLPMMNMNMAGTQKAGVEQGIGNLFGLAGAAKGSGILGGLL